MTDVLTLADKLPDIIKKWVLILPMILAAIGSGSGFYQYFDKKDVMKQADIELENALEQTAAVAEHLGSYVPKVQKKVVVNSGCSECKKLIEETNRRIDETNNRIDEWHGRR